MKNLNIKKEVGNRKDLKTKKEESHENERKEEEKGTNYSVNFKTKGGVERRMNESVISGEEDGKEEIELGQ